MDALIKPPCGDCGLGVQGTPWWLCGFRGPPGGTVGSGDPLVVLIEPAAPARPVSAPGPTRRPLTDSADAAHLHTR